MSLRRVTGIGVTFHYESTELFLDRQVELQIGDALKKGYSLYKKRRWI